MELIYEQALKLILAAILSGLIGLEREKSHKPAGLRTHMLVCVGATLTTIISIDYFLSDYTRIVAGIVTGIGFISAGAIIAQGTKGVHGLTTAATLWVVAAIGICVGVGGYILAVISTILVVAILFMWRLEHARDNSVK